MNIILGITGSIACYKTFDLTRELVKSGHSVKIILTQGALEFIKTEIFKYLGVEDVYLAQDDFNISHLKKNQTVLHIELTKWADKIIIAPVSANTLSKLALGMASDLLLSTVLASTKPTLLFPAMNTNMWIHELTQKNINKLLELKNFFIFPPQEGHLACGDSGVGKFLDVEIIKNLIETFDFKQNTKKVLITAGATAAPIDPVRYITNPSTGKMGFEIAKVFLSSGYEVVMLAGYQYTNEINFITPHPRFKLLHTPTTSSMKEMALSLFPETDLYISTAAIADIEFSASNQKIKKESMGDTLLFHKAPDILQEVLKIKKIHQKIIGFAAETDTSPSIFQEKIKRKPVDLLVGNQVSSGLTGTQKTGFERSQGTYYFICSENVSPPETLTKRQVGEKILNWFEKK
jgi:phosphopantothenoylcysteine decarboxylase/phosphopantothenate--cysteine ligase